MEHLRLKAVLISTNKATEQSVQRAVAPLQWHLIVIDQLSAYLAQKDELMVDILLIDLEAAQDETLTRVNQLIASNPEQLMFLLADAQTIPLAQQLVAAGAYDYIEKDQLDNSELGRVFYYAAKSHQIETSFAAVSKFEAIGRLASSIIHEINNPLQYIFGNMQFVQKCFDDVLKTMHEAQSLESLDVDFLSREVPMANQATFKGLQHISHIIQAMKEFSHPGDGEKTPCDLHSVLRNAITLTGKKWKYIAEMKTDFDPDLPLIPVLVPELSQVFLNLLINAIHAIEDKKQDCIETITIQTRHDGDWIEIRISDTGKGIPEEIQPRIFTRFFTTKAAGRGTGQGLALAQSIIVEQHQGSISCESEPGEGTTFILRLPLIIEEVAPEAVAL